MEGELDAKLCRLLAKAPTSPYWRYAENDLLSEAETENKTIYQFVWDECFKAYSIEKLPELVRNFLLLCDRSIEVQYELYEGRVSGLGQEEEDKKVIAAMSKGVS